jgi:ABC-2 type transport system permease protein
MNIFNQKNPDKDALRLRGFIRKESLQVIRDPSSILIAFVLPLILMFVFGAGVSLDANNIKMGLVMEDNAAPARNLASYFVGTPYFSMHTSDNSKDLEDDLWASKLRGVIIIPQNFSQKFYQGSPASVQILADGSETNTANFVINFAEAVVGLWLLEEELEQRIHKPNPIDLETQVWFNPELKSNNVILPGGIAVIMSLIGTLLTSLVIAREWERGTMESIMATPIRIRELILGKVIPYFILGMGSMLQCFLLGTLFFGVPFRGSFLVLVFSTAAFLLTALGQGLIISTAARSQFVSSQIVLAISFLPALILSGFVFEIKSMPEILQWVTYIVPARYFVTILQTSFLAGTIWDLILPNFLMLCLFAVVLIWIPSLRLRKRLD